MKAIFSTSLRIGTFAFVALALVGCKKDTVVVPPTAFGCGFDGTWVACDTDGTDSQLMSLTFTGASLAEHIGAHAGVTDCSGPESGSFDFTGFFNAGQSGHSTRISGATDIDILPSADVFGCGAGNRGYTSLKFASDCGSFAPAAGTPGCDPLTAPVTLGTLNFVKQ